MASAMGDVVWLALKAGLDWVRNCCCSDLSPCPNGAVMTLNLGSAKGTLNTAWGAHWKNLSNYSGKV